MARLNGQGSEGEQLQYWAYADKGKSNMDEPMQVSTKSEDIYITCSCVSMAGLIDCDH